MLKIIPRVKTDDVSSLVSEKISSEGRRRPENFFPSLIKVEFGAEKKSKIQKINISYFPVKQKPKFTSSKDLFFYQKEMLRTARQHDEK